MHLKSGIYKHYKGNLYKVIGVGRDSETLEEVVIYQGLYDSEEFGDQPLWVRPLKMFLEKVKLDNKFFPRFTYIGQL